MHTIPPCAFYDDNNTKVFFSQLNRPWRSSVCPGRPPRRDTCYLPVFSVWSGPLGVLSFLFSSFYLSRNSVDWGTEYWPEPSRSKEPFDSRDWDSGRWACLGGC